MLFNRLSIASCRNESRNLRFYERTSNVRDAAQKLGTFLPVLDDELDGASRLFRRRLAERLQWVKKESLAEQERELTRQYLKRSDFVRAAIFGLEACVTHVCERRKSSVVVLSQERQDAASAFESELKVKMHPSELASAWWTLKSIRNALAHGTHEESHLPHNRNPHSRTIAALNDPSLLRRELRACMDRFFEFFD